MANFNDVGRLTADPDLRFTQGNAKAVCTFILAVDRDFKNGEGKVEADFHPVEIWGKLGEVAASNLQKGRLIQIKGNIRNNTYTDQTTGKKVYGYKIVAEKIRFLDYKKIEQEATYEIKED